MVLFTEQKFKRREKFDIDILLGKYNFSCHNMKIYCVNETNMCDSAIYVQLLSLIPQNNSFICLYNTCSQ